MKVRQWLNRVKDAWHTKISCRPIIYVTNEPVRVKKSHNGGYDIMIGDMHTIRIVRASNEQMLRGYRASLAIYDNSVADIDYMTTRIECMAYDGVMEHTESLQPLLREG